MIWLGIVATLIVLLTIKTRLTQHTLSVEILKIVKIIDSQQNKLMYLSREIELINESIDFSKDSKPMKYET